MLLYFSLGIVLSGEYGHHKIEGMEVFKKQPKDDPDDEDTYIGELCHITDGMSIGKTQFNHSACIAVEGSFDSSLVY